MYTFSVIIPVFNAEATLSNCLESVKKQSFTNLEVIVVNDGSTDSSESIARNFEDEFDQITFLTQENKGLGNARNVAASKAKGEWLAFIDADDTWQANKLEIVHQAILADQKLEFIYHSIFERYRDGRIRKRKFAPISDLNSFMQNGNPFVPSATVIQKSIFNKHGGFIEDRNQVEDLLLWIKLLHGGIKVCAVDKPLTVYAVGDGVTANLEDHLAKVEQSLQQALQDNLINEADFNTFQNRKSYEAARQLHKLGQHKKASTFYQKLRDPSAKQKALAFTNKLGISI